MKKRAQHWLGVATMLVLVGGGVVLFMRGDRGPNATDCDGVVDRYASVYGEHIGPSYTALLEPRRGAIERACTRYGTPAFVACTRAASAPDALSHCLETGLRAWPSADAPTHEACVDQADWRIALHEQLELPSIADGIAATRDNMIATCEEHWSAPYVECLAGAPSLAFAQACEKVGRVRR